jgi:hypothetical protein
MNSWEYLEDEKYSKWFYYSPEKTMIQAKLIPA